FISDPKVKHSNIHSANDTEVIDNGQSIWRDIVKPPKKRAVIIFFTFDMFVYNISQSIYGAELRAQYNLTYEQMALIALWLIISNLIFLIPEGHLTDKIGKKRSLIICELFGLGFFFTLILAFILWCLGFHQFLIPLLCIGNILLGLNLAAFIPSAQMILTDLDETRKAESYGVIDFIRGIGFLPTGIIGGFLTEKISYIFPFVLSFIGIIVLIWYLRKSFDENN
ncbi:MAG: MFS transporter, partial [Promethearchaeota archaeon]